MPGARLLIAAVRGLGALCPQVRHECAHRCRIGFEVRAVGGDRGFDAGHGWGSEVDVDPGLSLREWGRSPIPARAKVSPEPPPFSRNAYVSSTLGMLVANLVIYSIKCDQSYYEQVLLLYNCS